MVERDTSPRWLARLDDRVNCATASFGCRLLVAFQKFVSRSAMGIQAVLGLVESSLFQRKPLADLLRGRKQDPPDTQMPLRLRPA